jgi:hypothetical protein
MGPRRPPVSSSAIPLVSAPAVIARNARLLMLATLALLGLFSCAEATSKPKTEPAPIACREGLTVGVDGECGIPSIGPGDVTAPQEDFEAPTIDNSDLDEARAYFLTQEGPGKFKVFTGETITVGVRAITYVGQPAPGLTVVFKPVGELYGTTLGSTEALTNQFGVAQITLTGGQRPTHFVLQMTAAEAAGLQYQVDVVQPPLGPDGEELPPPEEEVEPEEPVQPDGDLNPGAQCVLETRGTYAVHNQYEPARFLGDGPFQIIDQVAQALASPGGFVADLIADRIGGIWGDVIRAAVGPVVDYLFDYIVSNYAPDWAQWMLIIAEDVSGLLTRLEIEGTMELGPVDAANCTLRGSHRWDTLVFIWRAGCPAGNDQCGRFPIALQEFGVALSESEFDASVSQALGPVARMEIGNHSLDLNVGVAVLWFVEHVILPQRLEVNSFGELLGLVLPCDAVGQLAADYLSGIPFLGFAVAPFVEEACESGLEAAGNFLTRQIAESLDVSTFQMSGECKLRDTSGDRTIDKLEEGRWTQGFQGDFRGERR